MQVSHYQLLIIFSLLISGPLFSIEKAVYGADDRVELDNYFYGNFSIIADSTLTMIKKRRLQKIEGKGSYTFSRRVKTLKKFIKNSFHKDLCDGERFAQQPTAAHCTGFLIAPDILMTAAHCIRSFDSKDDLKKCRRSHWVLDYTLNNPSNSFDMEFPEENVYSCKKILKKVYEEGRGFDYAIIKLDRKVVGREPLKLTSSEKVKKDEELVIIGHPWGLPKKIAGGAFILNNDHEKFFVASLDSFSGNSGSPVFNFFTEEVEGILVRGRQDHIIKTSPDGVECVSLNVCDQDGGNCLSKINFLEGEEVVRMSAIKEEIEKIIKAEEEGRLPFAN